MQFADVTLSKLNFLVVPNLLVDTILQMNILTTYS